MEKIIIYKKIDGINYFYGETSSLYDFITNETAEKEHLETLYALVQGVEIKLFDPSHAKSYFGC